MLFLLVVVAKVTVLAIDSGFGTLLEMLMHLFELDLESALTGDSPIRALVQMPQRFLIVEWLLVLIIIDALCIHIRAVELLS